MNFSEHQYLDNFIHVFSHDDDEDKEYEDDAFIYEFPSHDDGDKEYEDDAYASQSSTEDAAELSGRKGKKLRRTDKENKVSKPKRKPISKKGSNVRKPTLKHLKKVKTFIDKNKDGKPICGCYLYSMEGSKQAIAIIYAQTYLRSCANVAKVKRELQASSEPTVQALVEKLPDNYDNWYMHVVDLETATIVIRTLSCHADVTADVLALLQEASDDMKKIARPVAIAGDGADDVDVDVDQRKRTNFRPTLRARARKP